MWGKLREAVRELGWCNGLLYVTARGLEAVTGGAGRIVKYRFVAQPVPHEALSSSGASGITIRRIDSDDVVVAQFPRPAHIIARRYRDGAICFAALKGSTLAGFIWIKQTSYMEDEVRCLYVLEPASAAAWDFDVWVAPEFRLGRTFARLWDAANTFMREQGYRWSVSRISAFNAGSFASHRRLGIRSLHSGLFLLLGRLQISLLSCRPFVHVGFDEDHYPVLRLRVPDALPQT